MILNGKCDLKKPICETLDAPTVCKSCYEAEQKVRAEARLKRGRRIRKKRKRSNDEASAAHTPAAKVQKLNQASGVDAGNTSTPTNSQSL